MSSVGTRSAASSPAPSSSGGAPPAPRTPFNSDLLRAYMKKLLASTLGAATWPDPRERARVKGWMREIGERVKERMLGASAPAPGRVRG
jgi:hypothetical protein